MFNLVYEINGKISRFRVTCLAVASVCFISGTYLKLISSNDTVEVSSRATAPVSTSVDISDSAEEKFTAEDKTLAFDYVQIRQKAVQDLKKNDEYMGFCSVVDHNSEQCKVSIEKDLSPYYVLSYDVNSEGYNLHLEATEQNKDKCKIFEINSNGEWLAINENGDMDADCLDRGVFDSHRFALVRDTDNNDGQIAPSGLAPIGTILSSR